MMLTFRIWTMRGVRYVKVPNALEGVATARQLAFQIHNSFETKRPAFVEMIETLNWQEML